jgi:hypothetical protein
MKAQLIRRYYLVAQTDDGKEYQIDNFPLPIVKDERICEIEGHVQVEEKQIMYEDGSPSNTYHEVPCFIVK